MQLRFKITYSFTQITTLRNMWLQSQTDITHDEIQVIIRIQLTNYYMKTYCHGLITNGTTYRGTANGVVICMPSDSRIISECVLYFLFKANAK